MAAKSSASVSIGGSIDRHVVSPSLLKMFETPNLAYKPRPEFLLGLGEPIEPKPWYLDCVEEDDTMLQASQAAEEQLSNLSTSTSRWASPKSTVRLQQIREGGVPKSTKKQTDLSLSVWAQWASYRATNLIEDDEQLYELDETLLRKLVLATQVHRWSQQGWCPVASTLQTAFIKYVVGFHGLWSLLTVDIDIFNSPNFHQFWETLDACMKDLKVSGNLTIRHYFGLRVF